VLVEEDISVDNPGWACVSTNEILGGKLSFYLAKAFEKLGVLAP
jgi:hypothetical protein